MNGITILQNNVSFYSSPDEETCDKLKKLAKEIFDSIRSEKSSASSASNKGNIEKEALFKLSYGLFVLSSSCNGRDNGCIINTAMQITDTPCRIAIALNKNNYTHDIISESGVFNISVISRKAGFDIFKKFGFVSGRDTDKFSDCSDKKRSSNGVFYLTEGINAYLSASVISSVDCGTHTLFTADVTEAKVLDKEASATYEYYFSDIKPKSGINTSQDSKKSQKAKIKGYICRICGFIYEGDTLPDDFICPICNHTADDFEPIYESDDDSDYGKNNDDEKNAKDHSPLIILHIQDNSIKQVILHNQLNRVPKESCNSSNNDKSKDHCNNTENRSHNKNLLSYMQRISRITLLHPTFLHQQKSLYEDAHFSDILQKNYTTLRIHLRLHQCMKPFLFYLPFLSPIK